jgi:CheY-like chemotaxis protein
MWPNAIPRKSRACCERKLTRLPPLKAAGVSLPVIFMTGNENPPTRMAAMASGCLAYLTKPWPNR